LIVPRLEGCTHLRGTPGAADAVVTARTAPGDFPTKGMLRNICIWPEVGIEHNIRELVYPASKLFFEKHSHSDTILERKRSAKQKQLY
jgi:hypothetical protein